MSEEDVPEFATENLQEWQTDSLAEGESWLYELLLISPPGTPVVQSPPALVVEIPQPLDIVEITRFPSASPGSIPVVGRNKLAKGKNPPKQVTYFEVTVVEPPALELSNADDQLDQMQSTILEWRKLVADMLPEGLLVPALPRRRRQPVQMYSPCSWPEFIERAHEEEYKKANARRPKRCKRITEALEGPSDPVGTARDAIVEIYSERLDAAEFGKYTLFDNKDMVSQN